jgi:acyl-coenzyme A synthetase/AMP-(fatty) acid ligase
MVFYKSENEELSYLELVKNINEANQFSPQYFAKKYADFVVNLLLCIIHDIDVTLLDYRNYIASESKCTDQINVKVNIKDLAHLKEKIASSNSSIGVYSSGTEGKPKLIFQPIQRLLKSVQVADQYFMSKWAFTYNPSHSAGIQVMLQVMMNDGTLYDFYRASRSYIIGTIEQDKLTNLSATPTFYRMLAPHDFSWPWVNSLTFNGEKSTEELLEKIRQCCVNAKLRNIYGSTESGPLMSSESTVFTIPDRITDKVKIVDGELWLLASLVSSSTNALDWYATGDLVKIENEDPLQISFVSRKSRIINVAGQNVNPQEIEEVLLTHPSIKDVQVIPKSNQLIGNLITASVVSIDPTLTEKQVIDFLRDKLAQYKLPRIIKFVDSVIVGDTGKKSIR